MNDNNDNADEAYDEEQEEEDEDGTVGLPQPTPNRGRSRRKRSHSEATETSLTDGGSLVTSTAITAGEASSRPATTTVTPSSKRQLRRRGPTRAAAAAAASSASSHRSAADSSKGNTSSRSSGNTTTTLENDDKLMASLLWSTKKQDVVKGLNSLLQSTVRHDSRVYTLPDYYEIQESSSSSSKLYERKESRVLEALIHVFDSTLGWNPTDRNKSKDSPSESADHGQGAHRLVPSPQTWLERSSKDEDTNVMISHDELSKLSSGQSNLSWPQFCKIKFGGGCPHFVLPSAVVVTDEEFQRLNAVMVIFRNLSFMPVNTRHLVYSANVLRILAGCLYSGGSAAYETEGASSSSSSSSSSPTNISNLCLHALTTLTNMVPQMEFTGRKYFTDQLFLDPSNLLGFGGMWLARKLEESRNSSVGSNVSSSVLDEFGGQDEIYRVSGHLIHASLSIFPPTVYAMCDCGDYNRSVVVACLDFLKELLLSGGGMMDEVFRWVPDKLLDRLVDLLWIPRLGPDSLSYIDPLTNVVSRVSTLRLMAGYDATIDAELRDKSLELLVLLTELAVVTPSKQGSHDNDAAVQDIALRLARRIPMSSPTTASPVTENVLGNDDPTANRSHGASKKQAVNGRLLDNLLPVLTTQVGRSEVAHEWCCRLLRNLVPYSKEALLFLETNLLNTLSLQSADFVRRLPLCMAPHVYAVATESVTHES